MLSNPEQNSVHIEKRLTAVFTSGSAKRSIGRHSDSGNIASVSKMVGTQFALGQLPDLPNFDKAAIRFMIYYSGNNSTFCKASEILVEYLGCSHEGNPRISLLK